MKTREGSQGMREALSHLRAPGANVSIGRNRFFFASDLPDLSRFSAIGRRIPFITLPPDRPQSHRVLHLMAIVVSVGFLGGCTEVSSKVGLPIKMTSISQIVKQPRVGSSVNINGTVTQQAPFLKGGAYEIQDETGKIWVMRDRRKNADRPLPNSGAFLKIKATVRYESIPMGQKEFGEVYLDEQKLLE